MPEHVGLEPSKKVKMKQMRYRNKCFTFSFFIFVAIVLLMNRRLRYKKSRTIYLIVVLAAIGLAGIATIFGKWHTDNAHKAIFSNNLYTLDEDGLLLSKKNLSSGDNKTERLVSQITQYGEAALNNPIQTVTAKSQTPPSGDKHDYMSFADYWWPNPNTADGLPYVHKDGQINPMINDIPDKSNFTHLINDTNELALTYFFTNDGKYAVKAAQELRAWFINPDTKMNPNLNFSQVIPGQDNGGTGLIDLRELPQLLDDLTLIAPSNELTDNEQTAFKDWMTQYVNWLITSQPGSKQAKAQNNHGSWYDAQIIAISGFLGDQSQASFYAKRVQRLIDTQIKANGKQPLELARTKSWDYSILNLQALISAGIAAKPTGVDVLHYTNSSGGSITKAFKYLTPFATDNKSWSYQQIAKLKQGAIANPLLEARYELHDNLGVSSAELSQLGPDTIIQLEFPAL